MRTLRTTRLVLTPWSEADIDTLHEMWTDADIRRYLFDDQVIPWERADEIVAGARWCWLIRLDGQEGAIGFCGFLDLEDTGDMELVYGLFPRFWGKGLATEAACGALRWLWETTGLERVFARTDPPNAASIAVMERLGMRRLAPQRGPAGQLLICYRLDRPQPRNGFDAGQPATDNRG